MGLGDDNVLIVNRRPTTQGRQEHSALLTGRPLELFHYRFFFFLSTANLIKSGARAVAHTLTSSRSIMEDLNEEGEEGVSLLSLQEQTAVTNTPNHSPFFSFVKAQRQNKQNGQ